MTSSEDLRFFNVLTRSASLAEIASMTPGQRLPCALPHMSSECMAQPEVVARFGDECRSG
jgi:hypothetical protein